MKNFFIKILYCIIYAGIIFGGIELSNWIATKDFWIDFFADSNPDNAGVLLIVGVFLSYPIVLGIVVPLVIVVLSYILDKFLRKG